jgi:hypothetical protein
VILGAAPASIAGGGDRNQVAAVDLGIYFVEMCGFRDSEKERNFCFCFLRKLCGEERRAATVLP